MDSASLMLSAGVRCAVVSGITPSDPGPHAERENEALFTLYWCGGSTTGEGAGLLHSSAKDPEPLLQSTVPSQTCKNIIRYVRTIWGLDTAMMKGRSLSTIRASTVSVIIVVASASQSGGANFRATTSA